MSRTLQQPYAGYNLISHEHNMYPNQRHQNSSTCLDHCHFYSVSVLFFIYLQYQYQYQIYGTQPYLDPT